MVIKFHKDTVVIRQNQLKHPAAGYVASGMAWYNMLAKLYRLGKFQI